MVVLAGLQGDWGFILPLSAVGFPCSPLLFLPYNKKAAHGIPDPHLNENYHMA